MEICHNIVMKNIHNNVSTMITKEFEVSRVAIHYHSLHYTDQSTSEEIDADKFLVNLSIALYTLFIELDKFINIHWSYRNDPENILQHCVMVKIMHITVERNTCYHLMLGKHIGKILNWRR